MIETKTMTASDLRIDVARLRVMREKIFSRIVQDPA
jgi:hypothetical protein